MNPLYLTEADVVATLTVRDAIGLVEDAARAQAEGRAQNHPRTRSYAGGTGMNVLPAQLGGRMGHKTYTTAPKPRGAHFWFTLYADSGEMLAIVEADALGQLRTGAASAVATRYLARDDARTLAVIGTGWQARTQLEACTHVRPIARVLVYGRDARRKAAFCDEMTAHIGLPVEPAESANDAVAPADVVCTMTSSAKPVFDGTSLRDGAHVNAAGSNRTTSQEIDVATVRRARIVVVEDVAQAKVESGDLLPAVERGAFAWDNAVLLSDLVAGRAERPSGGDGITLFESLGIGLWDVAAASHVFDACVTQGRGTRLPFPS